MHRPRSAQTCALAAFLALALTGPVIAGSLAPVSDAAVKSHASQGDVRTISGATAALVRSQEGAFVSVRTTNLNPGHAYTMWVVTINDPAACETSPCKSADVFDRTTATGADMGLADGIVARADGTAEFAAHIPVGPLPHAWFGHGLRHADAEIHVTIADHGPVIPELAGSMLASYRGGCTDESLSKRAPASAIADGEPGPNTCRLVQFAIFPTDAEAS